MALSAPPTTALLALTMVRHPAELRSATAALRVPEPDWAREHERSPEPGWAPELQLDAAEHRAVSIFVGAGLVSAEVARGFRALRESAQQWGSVCNVG